MKEHKKTDDLNINNLIERCAFEILNTLHPDKSEIGQWKGMASNVGRSMKSLMTAISTGMQSLGAGFRRPKLISNMFSSFIPKEPEYNIVHSSVPPPAVHYPAVQHKPVISYPQLEPINTPIVGNYVSAPKPQYPVEPQPPYSPVATPSHHPAVDSEPQYSVDIPSQQYYVPESPPPQKEQQYVPSNPVYTKPETSYAPPQPNEAAAAAPTTEQDEYGVPSGDLVPLGSYFVAPPQEFILSNWKMIIIAFLGSNL